MAVSLLAPKSLKKRMRRGGWAARALGRLGWRLEALGVRAAWGIAARMEPDAASAMGARWLGRIGPRLPKHRQVLANLKIAFPDASEARIAEIARGVWRNAGASFAEYPHLGAISADMTRIETHGLDDIADVLSGEVGGVFVGGHIANWELNANAYCARQRRVMTLVHSALSNPLLEAQLARWRARLPARYVRKSEAAAALIGALRANETIGVLIDQRFDDGEELTFFGHPAPTATLPARLALAARARFIVARTERTGPGARFRLSLQVIEPPPDVPAAVAARAMTAKALALFEDWIRARPDEWMCTKRRWKRSRKREKAMAARREAAG